MVDVPKLNLSFSSDEQSEPLFTVAPSSRSTRSSSTVSWGTESSDRSITPRNAGAFPGAQKQRQQQPHSTNPPWATHLPLNRAREEKPLFTGDIPVHPNDHSDTIVSTKPHPNTEATERICCDLESALRRRNMTEVNENDTLVNPTPRQLSMISLRQEPGLVRPKVLDTYRSTVSTTTGVRRLRRIWFTARLDIFDPFDLYPTASQTGKRGRIVERRNSISSWALRTFTGLAFPDDSTIALYEDHKTGKGTRPLPFLSRQVYRCAWGDRSGQPYMPEIDLFPGAILFVTYPYVECAPIPLRHFLEYTTGVIRIHILSVDVATRQRALEEELGRQNLPEDLWYSVMAKLHVARLPIKPTIQVELHKLQAHWRRDLRQRTRPIDAFLQLYRYYYTELASTIKRHANSDQFVERHTQLCREVLEQGLRWFRLSHVNEQSLQVVWQAWEYVAGYDGAPHFTDFLHLAFGDLPNNQRILVVKAFTKMDPTLLGYVSLNELRRFYTSPSWAIKEYGRTVVPTMTEFLDLFRNITRAEDFIEFSEFQAFYLGLSIALGECPIDQIADDSQIADLIVGMHSQRPVTSDKFERIVRDCWSI